MKFEDAAARLAASEGLTNIEFRCGDATRTAFPDGSFDAVICVFGVFFAPDMSGFAAEMWRLVRPGGVLAITTWAQGSSSPPTPSSGNRCARSSHRCSKRSTPGMRSPLKPPSRTCYRAVAWSTQT